MLKTEGIDERKSGLVGLDYFACFLFPPSKTWFAEAKRGGGKEKKRKKEEEGKYLSMIGQKKGMSLGGRSEWVPISHLCRQARKYSAQDKFGFIQGMTLI